MTKGYVRVEDEVNARIRRNALIARTADPDDGEARKRLADVVGAALLLSWVVGASAASRWVEGKTGAVRVAQNLGVALDRLRVSDLTAKWVQLAEITSAEGGIEITRQIAARAIETMDGFSPEHVKAAVENVSKSLRRPSEPLAQQAVEKLRSHERVAELIVRQASYAAYNDAVAMVASSDAGVRKFPVWRIDETMDDVTRGNPDGEYPQPHRHWQFSGYVNSIASIIAQRIVPPNGWNCRASLVPVTVADARMAGWIRPDGTLDEVAVAASNGVRQQLVDEGVYPDRGFVRAGSA